jgi:hypothetical protein
VILDEETERVVMDAIRSKIAGGVLELCTTDTSVVLARFKFTDSAGVVVGGTWRLEFVTPTTEALRGGRAAIGCIRDRNGTARISGLSVGMRGDSAEIVINNTQINKGQLVTIDGEQVIEHC